MADNDYQVLISADATGLTGAMQEASEATEELKGHLEGVGEAGEGAEGGLDALKEKAGEAVETFAKLGEGLLGVSQLLGASVLGEAIHQTMEEFIELGTEVQRVSTIMGVSSAEGHAWVDAAELSGVSANAFTQAARVMNTQVASGGKALQAMGISMRDAGGDIKSTGDLIEESITKLESYSASAERNALAQKTLGRAWIDLVANGNELLAMIDRTKEEFAGAGSVENTLVAQTKQLQAANAEMKISWDAIVQSAGPALIHIMRSVADSIAYVTAAALEATAAIQSMFTMASHAGDVASGIGKMLAGGGSENPLTDPSASASIKAGWDQIAGAVKAAGDEANKFSDKAKEIDDGFLKQRERIWNPPGITGVSPGTQPGAVPAPAMPGKGGGGGGRHGGGGGGGADDLEAMQNKLADIQPEMDKLNQEFSKMGSEATMAAKASSDSFDTLK